ncbi:MAG: 4-hydroxy-tetrahydrodipicolinate synthase [Planctomycetota bacterium]
MRLEGNIVALVTPFRNGAVDAEALRAHVDRVLAGGVHGISPCGTTGESPTLTAHEHQQVIEAVVERVAGRVPVIAGAGSNCTTEAVRQARAAASAGADAILSVTPYYNRPQPTGLLRHFRSIADATSLPVVLYDVPGRCALELPIETIAALAEHPLIVAIKDATGTIGNVTRIRSCTNLAVLSGDDAVTLPILALGGSGVISVLSNVLAPRVTQLVDAVRDGDLTTAREQHDQLYPLVMALFADTNPVPVKLAMAAAGWIDPAVRPPLGSTTDDVRRQLDRTLAPFQEELLGGQPAR